MRIPDLPTEPWKKVGTDLFHCNGKKLLLITIQIFQIIALFTNTTAKGMCNRQVWTQDISSQ